MAGDLRQVGVFGRTGARFGGNHRLVQAPCTDDQDALSAQMHRRRDRRRLAHGTVAEELAPAIRPERHRGKDERDRRRRHQVFDGDRLAHRDALRAVPGLHAGLVVVEGHVHPGAVARGRHGQRLQVALAHHVLQPLDRHQLGEQFAQRAVVEERARAGMPPLGQHPADRQHGEPARAGLDDAKRIGAVDLIDAEVGPGVDQRGQRLIEVVGTTGERGRVDGTGRGAGDHVGGGARRAVAVAPDARDGLEHTNLVGRARAAAGQDESRHGRGVHGHQSVTRGAGNSSDQRGDQWPFPERVGRPNHPSGFAQHARGFPRGRIGDR